MRVAVTGGAGYIGSVVVEALVERGHSVLVIDNLCKGHRDTVPPAAEFSDIDLADGARLTRVLSDFSTDAVVHMAAYSLVGESVTDPAKYYDNNVTTGLSLLASMREANVNRIVFSSTAAVYGEPVKQPIEETDRTQPTNPYGDTKLAFERALQWYGKAYGIRSISLRYFNAAGATARNGERHDPETHLIPLVLAVAAGRLAHITIFGDDYPTRDGTCGRHLRARLHPRGRSRRRARARYRIPRAGTGLRALQPWLRRSGVHRQRDHFRSAKDYRP
jgi:UDP-glucose 4-epimerase